MVFASWEYTKSKHFVASYVYALIIYHTQEIFGGGKFWRTVQVKAIGKEKFGE